VFYLLDELLETCRLPRPRGSLQLLGLGQRGLRLEWVAPTNRLGWLLRRALRNLLRSLLWAG